MFHYNIPGAVKALQRLQNEKDQLKVNAFEEIESLLRFLQSFAGIHQRVFFGLQKVLKSPELVKIVLSSSFDDFDFYSKTESIEKSVLAEAIEIRGMLKMMVMQLKSTKYTDEYMNLIKDFLCRDINVKGILMCQKISITDRLPFLIRFAPEQLLACVEECVKEAIDKGYLEFIMMLEDESEIVDLVQAYLDRSHDIQTAAIVGLKLLSVKLVTTEINVNKISQWYKNYQRFLNKNQLFTERTNTDEKKIEIFKNCLNISKEEQTKATELYFYCWNCKNPYSLTQYVLMSDLAKIKEAGQRYRENKQRV